MEWSPEAGECRSHVVDLMDSEGEVRGGVVRLEENRI